MNFKEMGETLGLEEEEYLELIELFIDTGSAEYERLKSALSASDFDLMTHCAHTIKGAAGNLGLSDIQYVASRIEKHAAAQNPDGLGEAMHTLGEKFRHIKAFVRGQPDHQR